MFHRGKMIRCLTQNIISDCSKLLLVFFLIIEIYFPQNEAKEEQKGCNSYIYIKKKNQDILQDILDP